MAEKHGFLCQFFHFSTKKVCSSLDICKSGEYNEKRYGVLWSVMEKERGNDNFIFERRMNYE